MTLWNLKIIRSNDATTTHLLGAKVLKTPGFTLLTAAEILEHHQFTLKLTFDQDNYFEFYPARIQMPQRKWDNEWIRIAQADFETFRARSTNADCTVQCTVTY